MKTQPRALRGALAGVCAFTMLGLAGPAVYAEDAKADVDSVWINKGIAVIKFAVPSADGRGYLVDAEAGGAHAYTGIDASKSWTSYPRMGYARFRLRVSPLLPTAPLTPFGLTPCVTPLVTCCT